MQVLKHMKVGGVGANAGAYGVGCVGASTGSYGVGGVGARD